MKNSIKYRAQKFLNLKQYSKLNKPEFVAQINSINPPKERQYVLRMLIKTPFQEFKIPEVLKWAEPIIQASYEYQQKMSLEQPFCYITIRNGLVDTTTDDEWHVDGFSVNITHLPEQNYCWSNLNSTEYVEKRFNFPKNFDPKKHNIHLFLQDNIEKDDEIKTMKENGLYCFDPYVPHRRPASTNGLIRTFVRVSYTPIEIMDCNNTVNPLFAWKTYERDGIKGLRNKLIRYK